MSGALYPQHTFVETNGPVVQVISIELRNGTFVTMARRRKARSDGWRKKPLNQRCADNERDARRDFTALCVLHGGRS